MIVRAQSLARRFQRRWAYAHIDLSIEKGERLLLIGANGSGKTTLLRSLATLLPPSRGELYLFDVPFEHSMKIRHRIGFVSHSSGLYLDLSARDNLRVYAAMMGVDKTTKELENILEQVGLELRNEPVRFYSAGMKKRVSIALLLLKNPELVLLDEPFSALDPKGVEEIGTLLTSLDATVVMSSHQVETASTLCTRALLLEDGVIRWEGEASSAWKAWRLAQRNPDRGSL